MKKRFLFFIALSTLLLSCSTAGQSLSTEGDFIIWSHSDIQPKDNKTLRDFKIAVDDMSQLERIDISITAGDIVEKSRSEHLYREYLELRKKVNCLNWFEIAGNHEWRDIETYTRLVNPKLHYSVTAGNILLLFISNSASGRMTEIPDNVFQWWEQNVIENQDKIIITVTHGSLKNSGLLQSRANIERQFIKNSERFESVLKKYKVDIWISGHSHIPGYLPFTDYKNEDLGGTIFIDNGAIREDLFSNIESRVIIFKKDSDIVTIKHRDHKEKKYITSFEKEYRLSKKFHYEKDSEIKLQAMP